MTRKERRKVIHGIDQVVADSCAFDGGAAIEVLAMNIIKKIILRNRIITFSCLAHQSIEGSGILQTLSHGTS